MEKSQGNGDGDEDKKMAATTVGDANEEAAAEEQGASTSAAAGVASAAAAARGDDDEDDDEEEGGGGTDETGNADSDRSSMLRRQKRLQMNRESARARRKRKKLLIQTLEQEVSDLTKANQQFRLQNGNLTVRVTQLERELATARSAINMLTAQQGPLAAHPNLLVPNQGSSILDLARRSRTDMTGGALDVSGGSGLSLDRLLQQQRQQLSALNDPRGASQQAQQQGGQQGDSGSAASGQGGGGGGTNLTEDLLRQRKAVELQTALTQSRLEAASMAGVRASLLNNQSMAAAAGLAGSPRASGFQGLTGGADGGAGSLDLQLSGLNAPALEQLQQDQARLRLAASQQAGMAFPGPSAMTAAHGGASGGGSSDDGTTSSLLYDILQRKAQRDQGGGGGNQDFRPAMPPGA